MATSDPEQAALTQGGVGVALHETLIGDHGARVDVGADEDGASGAGHPERRARVVAKHVDAERHGGPGGADGARHHAEGRHRPGLSAAGREGDIAEVLYEERVEASLDEGLGIGEGAIEHVRHRALPARASGERRQVHHADQSS